MLSHEFVAMTRNISEINQFDYDLVFKVEHGFQAPGKWFNQQSLAMTLLALGKSGYQWHDLPSRFPDFLLGLLHTHVSAFNPQEIANSLWALGKMGMQRSDLNADIQARLLETLARNLPDFNPQNISNSLLALDKMGWYWIDFSLEIQARLLGALRRNLPDCNSQDTSNSLLALARLGCGEREAILGLIRAIPRKGAFLPEERQQLAMAQYYLGVIFPEAAAELEAIGIPRPASDSHASVDQRAVFDYLHDELMRRYPGGELKLSLELEALIGPFVADIKVTLGNLVVVIEVNGPSHYSSSGILRSIDVKKADVLRKHGCVVIQHRLSDPDAMSKTLAELAQYFSVYAQALYHHNAVNQMITVFAGYVDMYWQALYQHPAPITPLAERGALKRKPVEEPEEVRAAKRYEAGGFLLTGGA